MKKLIFTFCLIVLLSLFSCSKYIYSNFNYNKSKNPWTDAFKDRVFISSLKESYKNNKLIFELIEKKDALNPYDGLSYEALEKATLIGIKLITEMPPPTMCDDCNKDQNYYIATALHYYKSKQLDSIAIVEFKKFLSQQNSIGSKNKQFP